MKKLFFFLASIALMVACTESETGGDEPTPQPQKPSITIDSNTLSSFTEDGGKGTISFTASEAWSAEIINTRADSWISIHPTSGGAGEANITVTTEPNDTPDDRSATIVIKSGTVEKTVKISQKQKDALTVTAATFEVGNEGGEIEVEVKANIDFEYEIDEAAKEWIEYKGTRAIETSTLTFAVAENDDVEKREAKINIKSGEFNETITIYQAGAEPTLVISQSEYAVPSVGETIVVEVASNVDVTVELPADADWISESTTRSVSTNTFYFDIAANEEYDQRTAEIKFSNADKGISEVVTIVQAQKDAIVIAEDSYSVSGQGDAIEIAVGHNVEFDIEIDVDWISQVQTRALETSTLIFNVAQNETDAERSGTITFTSKDNDEISQVIAVKQEAGASKIYYTSTDGNIVEPKADADWGGAQIVSNTYENGQGVITFDGVVTKIGDNAFNNYEYPNLTSITIPESVTEIGVRVFHIFNNRNLSAFYGKYASEDNRCLIVDGKLNSFASAGLINYTIPNGVTSIGESAFENCSHMTYIKISDSVTEIGDYAFFNCELWKYVTIPNSVTSIGAGAFAVNRTCTSITIPESVTSIGDEVFYGCENLSAFYGKYASADNRCLIIDGKLNSFAPKDLTTYNIPEGITSIGSHAFASSYLRSITIPESVTEIGQYSFMYCSKLNNITIPESVTKIEHSAFYSCSSLTNIIIPQNVKSIGSSAFDLCSKLSEVNCKPTTPPTLYAYAFAQNASNRKIIVPAASVDAYKTANGWSEYANFIEAYTPYQGTLPVLNKESIASKIAGEFDRGGEGVGYHDLSGRNGGTPDVNPSGGVGYTTDGEWLAYTIYVEDAGTYKFTMYGAASQTAGTYGGSYQWFLDDPNVAENALGPRFKLQNSGSWAGPGAPSESVEFELSEGYQRIIFYMHDGYHELYNFTAEWVE